MKPTRWGILATGNVAGDMAQALQASPQAQVLAVASRQHPKAHAFGERWAIPRRYSTYQDLADDPEIDIVYIATPHNLHAENIRMCLEAGKHVLCEKAFTLNADQAQACIDLARRRGLFLMEAMWMRFFPAIDQVRRWLTQGTIGEVRLLQADFCFNLPFDPHHRLYNLHTGGGALLDLGVYPLSLALMVLGYPTSICSHAHFGETGVDELDAFLLAYENGAAANLSCSMRVYRPREAFIIGSRGFIKIHNIFFRPDRVTLQPLGQEAVEMHFPIPDKGYGYEVEEVHRCLQAGRLESERMPLGDSLLLMRLMDAIRAQWGFFYPDEMV